MLVLLSVALPAALIVYLRDAHLLPEVLSKLTKDDTAVWQTPAAEAYVLRWQGSYKRINLWSLFVAALMTIVAIF